MNDRQSITWFKWRSEFSKNNTREVVEHVDAIGELARSTSPPFDVTYWQNSRHRSMLVSLEKPIGTVDILDFYGDTSLKRFKDGCAYLFRVQSHEADEVNSARTAFADTFGDSSFWIPTDFELERIWTELSKLAVELHTVIWKKE